MITNIIGSNVCQLHTSLTPVNIVHIAIFTITLKMHSPCNVPCVFSFITIIIHTQIRLTLQYNQRIFLCNYIWILVQQFMN